MNIVRLNARSSLRRTQDIETVGMSFRLQDLTSTSDGMSNASSANQIKVSLSSVLPFVLANASFGHLQTSEAPRPVGCRVDIDIEHGPSDVCLCTLRFPEPLK